MKALKLYITEALHVNRNTKIIEHNYHPKTKDELNELIYRLIKDRGLNADLNDIDTSEITDMSYVFYMSKFDGDISEWDVSNVKDMRNMFMDAKFTGDISGRDTSNVENMIGTFAYSKFNGDISKWDVSKVKDMRDIFYNSPLENNPPKWWYRQ